MRRKKLLRQLALLALMLPVLAAIYLPVAWLMNASFSTRAQLLSVPMQWIARPPTVKNYLNILAPGAGASQAATTYKVTLGNSCLIAVTVTVTCLIIGSFASYALARIRFPFRQGLLIAILATRMIPEVSLVIPLYVLASRLGLLNTPFVLMATYLSFALPFAVWIMVAFFETIPPELEEAARIDGCSRLGMLFRVVLPISTPGLVSTGLFVFLLSWDEFFYALIFTSTVAAKTMPVAIAEFVGRYVTDVTGMMAGGILAAVPPVLLSLVFQRYIVRGMTTGAVKG